MSTEPTIGLGIDAGGTETRWALADAAGTILAEGVVAGLSALQMTSEAGRARLRATLTALAAAVRAAAQPTRVRAGLTGFGGDDNMLHAWLAESLGVERAAVVLCSDIEIAYRASFAPGAGYLVYAGTGSIGAYIDADGVFHRAGGRGVVLDDGGGGFWIAREAMRAIWRREDECPGAWQQSALARAVLAHVGGADWIHSRQFIYGQERGEVGKLAVVVAACAGQDPAADAILQEAGRELARLARALIDRFGPRPVVLAGRAAALHPLIAASMCASLPEASMLESAVRAHHAAARLAAADAVPIHDLSTDSR